MKKRDKIYDSPEYKQIKEHLPEILKELERDKGLSQYQIPEEWNGDFERIYQKECRKEHIKRRILAGACAALILTISAVHIGTHLEFTSVAQADDIGKTRENGFEDGKYAYSIYENSSEDDSYVVADDGNDVNFACTNVKELYAQIKQETKAPIFILNGISDEYSVEDAFYSKLHRILSYRLENGDQYLYVSQQKQVDDTENGTINDYKEKSVHIDELDINVDIYRSAQDNSLKCSIVYHNEILSLVANMELEEYETIIRSLEYH